MTARRLAAMTLFAFDGRLARRPVAARIAGMLRAWRTRTELAELDPHLLNDVGITPRAAAREAARLPWDHR